MYLANTNFCLYHRECAALKSTLQLSSLMQHHLLDRHPGVERFACPATGYTRKGTTGAMREAIPEGNSGRVRETLPDVNLGAGTPFFYCLFQVFESGLYS